MKLAFLELPRDERRLYIEQAAVRGAVRGQVSFSMERRRLLAGDGASMFRCSRLLPVGRRD
jgi:hypothetical protein